MGMVIIISLPLIFFCLLLGLGCYLLGRYKGRQEIRTNPEIYGVPAPPSRPAASFPSPPPPPPAAAPRNKPDSLAYA
ncbi:hypothetical protein Gotur_008629 [Gossypium turneri]